MREERRGDEGRRTGREKKQKRSVNSQCLWVNSPSSALLVSVALLVLSERHGYEEWAELWVWPRQVYYDVTWG